ncbi:MAG: hypothetical protein Q7J22_00095 [Candidatus Wolfebacteria bacterium]|nr:hypothetical protein [Candidatus Wolfebacteria bacterium]
MNEYLRKILYQLVILNASEESLCVAVNYEIDYFVIPAEADSKAVMPAEAGIQFECMDPEWIPNQVWDDTEVSVQHDREYLGIS